MRDLNRTSIFHKFSIELKASRAQKQENERKRGNAL